MLAVTTLLHQPQHSRPHTLPITLTLSLTNASPQTHPLPHTHTHNSTITHTLTTPHTATYVAHIRRDSPSHTQTHIHIDTHTRDLTLPHTPPPTTMSSIVRLRRTHANVCKHCTGNTYTFSQAACKTQYTLANQLSKEPRRSACGPAHIRNSLLHEKATHVMQIALAYLLYCSFAATHAHTRTHAQTG
jgi:hypothetical protein